jgi:seryl-tRNA synthetase
MIDEKLLLKEFDATAKRLQRKGVSLEEVVGARDALLERNRQLAKVESLRAERNRVSRDIGQLNARGMHSQSDALRGEIANSKGAFEKAESDVRAAEAAAREMILELPNLPSDNAPDGQDESANIVLRTVGYDQEKYKGRLWRPHWEIGASLNIMEPERAAKITGSMFMALRGDGSRLVRALVDLAFRLNEDTYEELLVPTMVNSATFLGTGHLPKFAGDAYSIRNDDLWMVPTGEVPLTGLHRDEILAGEALPLRYMTYTTCYRREAGATGRDTRGMQRLHEFHKVELVRLCKPEDVAVEFEELLEDALRPIEMLGLPYRIVDLCAGDLTFSSERIYDVEVYSPGVDKWLEVASVGIFGDFQMRRSNIRFRRGVNGPLEFPAALNGSGMATPRVWAAILENYQDPDGNVHVPSALRDFMKRDLLGRNG